MHIPHRRSWNAMSGLASSTQLRPVGAGRLLSFAGRLRLLTLRWRRTRAAAAELASMDDRMLTDIGLSRCEVPQCVRQGRGV